MKKLTNTMLVMVPILCVMGCATGPDFSQMSPEQIYAYQVNQQQQMMQLQGLMNQAQAGSQQMLNSQQQMLQSSSNYSAPVAQSPYPANDTVRCLVAGVYINCR